jgi:hypothetical protein
MYGKHTNMMKQLGDNEQRYVIEGCDTLKLNKTIIYKKMHLICANFGENFNKISFSFLPSCVWVTYICFALKLFVKSPYWGPIGGEINQFLQVQG